MRGAVVVLNGVLLGLLALAIVGVEIVDRGESAGEGSIRRYAAAVSHSDLEAAMAEILPSSRAEWREWVDGQLGNVYEVRGIAVRADFVVGPPVEVTAVLDVNRGDPDSYYQPSATVSVSQDGGAWYLAAPLLAPLD